MMPLQFLLVYRLGVRRTRLFGQLLQTDSGRIAENATQIIRHLPSWQFSNCSLTKLSSFTS